MARSMEGRVRQAIRDRYGTFKKARRETGIKSTALLKAWAAKNLLQEKRTANFKSSRASYVEQKEAKAKTKAKQFRALERKTQREVREAKAAGTTTEKLAAKKRASEGYADLMRIRADRQKEELAEARETRTKDFLTKTEGMTTPQVLYGVTPQVKESESTPSPYPYRSEQPTISKGEKLPILQRLERSYDSGYGNQAAGVALGIYDLIAPSEDVFKSLVRAYSTTPSGSIITKTIQVIPGSEKVTAPFQEQTEVEKGLIKTVLRPDLALSSMVTFAYDKPARFAPTLVVTAASPLLGGRAAAARFYTGESLSSSVLSQVSFSKRFPFVKTVPRYADVTKATGEAKIIQTTSGKSRIVLGATTKEVPFAKAPKRPTSRTYGLQIKGYAAGIQDDLAAGRLASGTAQVKFVKGEPTIKSFRATAKTSDIDIFSSSDLTRITVDDISTGARTVKTSYPVRGYQRTVIIDAPYVEFSKSSVDVRPYVMARDVSVKPSVRTTTRTVTDLPYDIEPFTSYSFFTGKAELTKLAPKPKSTPSTLSKPVSGIYVFKDDLFLGITKKSAPYIKKGDVKVKGVVKPTGEAVAVTETKATVKTAKSKPVLKVETPKTGGGLKVFSTGVSDVESPGRTGEIVRIGSVQTPDVKSGFGVRSITRSSSLSKSKPVLDVDTGARTGSRARPIINFKTPQPTATRERIIPALFTPQKSILEIKQTALPKSRSTPKNLVLPSLKFPGDSEPVRSRGFGVSVRRRGVFETVATGLTREEALFKGSSIVGTSAAASFKIFETGGFTTSTGGGGLLNPRDFYEKQQGLFIEKRGRRIKSTGELREITYKGISANRKLTGFKL